MRKFLVVFTIWNTLLTASAVWLLCLIAHVDNKVNLLAGAVLALKESLNLFGQALVRVMEIVSKYIRIV